MQVCKTCVASHHLSIQRKPRTRTSLRRIASDVEAQQQAAQQQVVPGMTFCGTVGYMAPEVQRVFEAEGRYGTAADIWSLGCVIYEAAERHFAFPESGWW